VNVSFLQEEAKSIECKICSKWFHAECEDLDSTIFEVLTLGIVPLYEASSSQKQLHLLILQDFFSVKLM